MNKIYRIITVLLLISLAACTSNNLNMAATDDEDRDIGLGGTGMLADTGSGLGGTGITGEITGFGSIFVNGIEVEYDSGTPFTIDGETAEPQQLEIGDIVEILTVDARQHTEAQIINLRHEVIGVVESVDPHTYSFNINGQSIIQSIGKSKLPEVGATIAVAGFRIDEKTILSTRVSPAKTGQNLLRSRTELPFDNKAQRWLIQSHIQNGKAVFKHDGETHVFALEEKTGGSFKDQLGIKILHLQESATEKLELKQLIEQANMPRGLRILDPVKQKNGNILQRSMPGTSINSNSGITRSTSQPKGKQNGR
ncbi:MAG: hypothetical protein IMF17_00140 [Proteobacteria bacterium]|nr:hypothetical protein [Pseudomonadota bacterium]